MTNQDQIFYKKEGDNWFKRNFKSLDYNSHLPLFLIEQCNLKPKKVLEIGCSNGWRLAKIEEKYGAKCFGVESSLKAIKDGQKKYPKVKFKRGLASSLPLNEKFDLVIVNFVLHWVSRENLLKTIVEIDRVISNKGFLIIGDFLPDYPARTPYHHLPKQKVYTYKQDYADIFISSRLYKLIKKVIFNQDEENSDSFINHRNRGVCCLLQKTLDTLYL